MKILSVPTERNYFQDKGHRMKILCNPAMNSHVSTKLYRPVELQCILCENSSKLSKITLLKLEMKSQEKQHLKLLNFGERIISNIESKNIKKWIRSSAKLPSTNESNNQQYPENFLMERKSEVHESSESHERTSKIKEKEYVHVKGAIDSKPHLDCKSTMTDIMDFNFNSEKNVKKQNTLQCKSENYSTVHMCEYCDKIEDEFELIPEENICTICEIKNKEIKPDVSVQKSYAALELKTDQETSQCILDGRKQMDVNTDRLEESVVQENIQMSEKNTFPKIRIARSYKTYPIDGLPRKIAINEDFLSKSTCADLDAEENFNSRLAAIERASVRIEEEYSRNTKMLQLFLKLKSIEHEKITEKAKLGSLNDDLLPSEKMTINKEKSQPLKTSSIADLNILARKRLARKTMRPKPLEKLPPKPSARTPPPFTSLVPRISELEKKRQFVTPFVSKIEPIHTKQTARENLRSEMAEKRRIEAIDYANTVLAEIYERQNVDNGSNEPVQLTSSANNSVNYFSKGLKLNSMKSSGIILNAVSHKKSSSYSAKSNSTSSFRRKTRLKNNSNCLIHANKIEIDKEIVSNLISEIKSLLKKGVNVSTDADLSTKPKKAETSTEISSRAENADIFLKNDGSGNPSVDWNIIDQIFFE